MNHTHYHDPMLGSPEKYLQAQYQSDVFTSTPAHGHMFTGWHPAGYVGSAVATYPKDGGETRTVAAPSESLRFIGSKIKSLTYRDLQKLADMILQSRTVGGGFEANLLQVADELTA